MHTPPHLPTLLVTLLCALMLVACGGSSSPAPAAPQPGASQPTPTPTPAPTPGSLPRWEDISPAGINYVPSNSPWNFGPHSLAMAPSNGLVVYVGTTAQGLYKSVDGGNTWLGRIDRSSYDCAGKLVDESTQGVAAGRNWTLAVDPSNPNIVYTTAGFGNIQGVWKSTDGGSTWHQKLCPGAVAGLPSLQGDVGTIKVDPHNPLHLLVATHSGWRSSNSAESTDSGIYESHDGGNTYVPHAPTAFAGVGTYIWVEFLGQRDDGSTDTQGTHWLLSSQSGGAWRTTNAGQSWARVSWLPAGTQHNRSHGGTDMYRAKSGPLYLGFDNIVGRSTDNGRTWQDAGAPASPDGYAGITGDGTYLYTMPSNTGYSSVYQQSGVQSAFMFSPESDGTRWSTYNDQTFKNGPLEMSFDAAHGYVYAMNWCGGIWRLRVKP